MKFQIYFMGLNNPLQENGDLCKEIFACDRNNSGETEEAVDSILTIRIVVPVPPILN